MSGRPHLIRSLRRRPLPLVVAGVLLSLGGVAGCGSDAVGVEEFPVDAGQREDCAALIAALPERVADQSGRTVDGSAYAAAWGEDDPIVLRCGVAMPAQFNATSTCHQANGVGWYIPPGTEDDQVLEVLMTTVHRSPTVEVLVPASLRPPVAAMVDLADAIKQHTRATGSCR